jgi:alpha-galactosidase
MLVACRSNAVEYIMAEDSAFTMQTKCYYLVGTYTHLLLKVRSVAEIVHYGRRLFHASAPPSDQDQVAMMASIARPIPFGRLDEDVPVSVHPELSRGFFGSPGLEGHRNGQDWAPQFVIDSVTKTKVVDGEEICLRRCDDRAQLQLDVTLHLDKYDVLQMRQSLMNLAESGYSVTRLANTVPLPPRVNEIMSYFGRWVKEFQLQRTTLGSSGGWIQENRRGRTSHEHYPAAVVGPGGFSNQAGEVWGAHLAWSGNHRMRVDVKADGRRVLQAEALYLPGECHLTQGESLTTPTLYMSYSNKGLNGMSQQFHQHVRRVLLNDRLKKPRPVHLNTWEGIYFKHDPQYIAQMATHAASIGVERFIVDDGWFMGRNDGASSLGDWYVDNTKYPEGICTL